MSGIWEGVSLRTPALFALTLKRSRVEQGKTMETAAAELGVGISTYQRWEDSYKFNPNLSTLTALAGFIGRRLELVAS